MPSQCAWRRLLLAALLCISSALAEFSWQTPAAEVTETGDIVWSPKPFEYRPGETIRYIDFDNGNDEQDGTTPATAWNHHPWDPNATDMAAQESGIRTYVFKRGVTYRGILTGNESGEKGNPIILTSDPDWGEGEACIAGATKLPASWVPATSVEAPQRMPQLEKVWAIDLDTLGLLNKHGDIALFNGGRYANCNLPFIGFFEVTENDVRTLHNARDPDWQPGNDNFVLDYWRQWDGEKYIYKDGEIAVRGGWDEDLKGFPQDYFTGGYIWVQYGSFMGTPKPRLIEDEKTRKGVTYKHYNPEEGIIYESVIGGLAARLRYMIENLPQYLDSPGEFYFEKPTGILYLRPEDGVNPNDGHYELNSTTAGIVVKNASNITISGLSFRYQYGAGVMLENNMENVRVENCRFADIGQYGVRHNFENWRVHPEPEWADNITISDCEFINIWETCIMAGATHEKQKSLGHIEILRNRIYNSGMRHKGNVQSAVQAIDIKSPITGEIAGNIVERTFGTGIMVEGSQGGKGTMSLDYPLSRILVHHNKTVNTALAVNDYGGLSIWQGGSIYCYNNNIGNSPGYMPAGILNWGGKAKKPTNLSYPLYLDGAYKVFSFNNIIWARSTDTENEQFATRTPGYFMVFGFLNQFVNNTLYRHGKGVGGSSGHRNDVIGNVFSEIKQQHIGHDRSSDPSLVGGGDDGTSGQRGVPTLAYANNVFYGEAAAGRLLKPNEPAGYPEGIEADSVEQLAQMMKDFPIRYGNLGEQSEINPIAGHKDAGPIDDLADVDFSLREGSKAVDAGAEYFVPWSLYGTVGEWHFTENHADPTKVIDYSWYMSKAHYNRSMYEHVPTQDLSVEGATLDHFVLSPSETWSNGALRFDGSFFASVSDEYMRNDIELPIVFLNRKGDLQTRKIPDTPWIAPEPISGTKNKYAEDAVAVFPGELRKNLILRTENLLLEANIRVEAGHTGGSIISKYDGGTGYRLYINDSGKPVFAVDGGGAHGEVVGTRAVNDGDWRHVLAEIDRETGKMSLYFDGVLSSSTSSDLPADASLDCTSDFLVGKSFDNTGYLKGEIDFMRVCRGTLADAQTSIEELYAWQTEGPFTRDIRGAEIVGARDAGAMELGGDVSLKNSRESPSTASDNAFHKAVELGIQAGQ